MNELRSERRRRILSAARSVGVKLGATAVCRGHCAPLDIAEASAFIRPRLMLVLGPRGGGKSFGAAFSTVVDSARHDRHETLILGGSEAQSRQIYSAIAEFRGPDGTESQHGLSLDSFTATRAVFPGTGSTVQFIPASPKSVRGPHVPTLRLDEVDEMDPDIRESSFGMCMEKHGTRASVSMTSTWHRVGGPMSELLERGDAGEFPVFRFCVWEVLERCPDQRSGPNLERCPSCPLFAMCHEDAADHGGVPKAKRSDGHYSIDALIQKLQGVSLRVFRSDYLCLGPKADGVWFTAWDESKHVRDSAEFDPTLPVHCAVDSGVFTGAVLFQVRRVEADERDPITRARKVRVLITVFGEYLAEGKTAEQNAIAILALIQGLAGDAKARGMLRVSTDAAGGARNPVGPTVLAEYERAGLMGFRRLETWPSYPGSVEDGLLLIEALLESADGGVSLTVHPRCRGLRNALAGYRRARRKGAWQDYPEDPQHPHEDFVDALRGGIKVEMPESRKPESPLRRVKAHRVV
jgi:hypothetical protein